jgi:hypothetical protein
MYTRFIGWVLAISYFSFAVGSEVVPSHLGAMDVVSRQSTKGKVVLGSLGRVIEGCTIYSKPDTHSDVYYQLKAQDYLVIQRGEFDWTRILLQNGTYGYAVTSKIAKLPYSVTAGNRPAAGPKLGGDDITSVSLREVGQPIKKSMRGGGFVRQVFASAGKKLPRSLAKQIEIGATVDRLENLKPGDRVYFWSKKRDEVDFAGIFVGKGYFIAPLPGDSMISTHYLGEKKWLDQLVAARR